MSCVFQNAVASKLSFCFQSVSLKNECLRIFFPSFSRSNLKSKLFIKKLRQIKKDMKFPSNLFYALQLFVDLKLSPNKTKSSVFQSMRNNSPGCDEGFYGNWEVVLFTE